MAVYDVPAGRLIQEMAADLEKKFNVQKPVFADYVKTGVSRERAPEQKNWYYLRTASILYRVFKDGPVGTESLRTYYGGRQNRGVKPSKFRKASGKIIRLSLQQLEALKFIKKSKKGRMIAGQGHAYLERKARELVLRLKGEETTVEQRRILKLEQLKKAEQLKARRMTEVREEGAPKKFMKKKEERGPSKKEKRKERKKEKKMKKGKKGGGKKNK